MELSLALLKQIGTLFLMVLCGYVLARAGIVKQSECGILTRISVYIFIPALLLVSFLSEHNEVKLEGMVIAAVLAVVIHIVFLACTAVISKITKLSEIDGASLTYTNVGNIMIPLVMGTIGSEYIVYSAAFMVVQNLIMWSYGMGKIGGQKKFQLGKVVKNPAIIAIFLGLLLMIFNVPVPSSVVSSLQSLGNCIAPVSMILVGIICAEFNVKEAISMKGIWKVVSLRLVLYPVIAIGVLFAVRGFVVHPDGWEILFVILLASSGPSAATVTQVAQLYENNPQRASCINVITTLFCAITLPIITLLAQTIL